MNDRYITTDNDALLAAREYYRTHYPALGDTQLASLGFEGGWLVGPSKENSPISERVGLTMLVVGHDGSVEETSSSAPPRKIIADYLSRRSR